MLRLNTDNVPLTKRCFHVFRATPAQRSGQRSVVEVGNPGDRKEVDGLDMEASDHRSGEEVTVV